MLFRYSSLMNEGGKKMKGTKVRRKWKLSAMAMLFAAGICLGTGESDAAVKTSLPQVDGLYVAEYTDWDESGHIKTDVDESGNTIPVNGDGAQIPWREQDNPDYLTDGVKDGWGQGFDVGDQKWFDYIADGKVTHVKASDLTITNMDGTPCDDITITANPDDPRMIDFQVNALKQVKITYNGADKNNVMIGVFALRSGFYTQKEMSIQSYVGDFVTAVRGTDKELYFHMTDDWEEAGFRMDDLKNAVEVEYWDQEKEEEQNLKGEDAAKYVSLDPVSTEDAHHLIYKVKLQGTDEIKNDSFHVRIHFTRFRIANEENEGSEDETWEEDRHIDVRLIKANALYAASLEDLTVKGSEYCYPEDAEFVSHGYFGAGSLGSPLYMLFARTDENGERKPVTDPARLTFYRSEWNEEKGAEELTKVDANVIKAEKAYEDSDIMKISYVGDAQSNGNEFIVAYEDTEPEGGNMDQALEVSFVTSDFEEIGTYKAASMSEASYTKELVTDGTADVVCYAGHMDISKEIPRNIINSVQLKNIQLTDEQGNDLSDKVSADDTVKMTASEDRGVVYGAKFTIPKGTLTSSAKMRLTFTLNSKGGDDVIRDYDTSVDLYIFYQPHTHTASEAWEKDTAYHWHVCAAGDGEVLDKEAHTWNAGVVTTAATTEKEGTKTYTCSVCGATKEEKLPKLPSSGTGTQDASGTGTSGTQPQEGGSAGTKTQEEQPKPAVGTTTTDKDGCVYTVTNISADGAVEAEFTSPGGKLKKVSILSKVTVNGVEAKVTAIADAAFANNKTVTAISIPATVKQIGKNACKNCTKLGSITIPKSVVRIGKAAFSGCTALKKVTFKTTAITTIEQGTFKNCKKLTAIIIPKNVKKIGKEAFAGNKKLKTITLKGTKITTMEKNAWKDVPSSAVVKTSKAKKKAYTTLLKKAGYKGKVK